MSTYRPKSITCPFCYVTFEMPILVGIHATRLPAVRQEILDGTFQRFACPACSAALHVEERVIYTDFDRSHYIAVAPPSALSHVGAELAMQEQVFEDSFGTGCQYAAEFREGMIRRLVFGHDALREKLLTWDYGLDDRRLELAKARLGVELQVPFVDCTWRLDSVLEHGDLILRGRANVEVVPRTWYEDPGDVADRCANIVASDWLVDLAVGARLESMS